MMKNLLVISSISLFPERGTFYSGSPLSIKNNKSKLCARAEVVLNDTLVLRGLNIFWGSFGYYLSFPHSHRGVAYKLYESKSMGFRKILEKEILKEFEQKQRSYQYIRSYNRYDLYSKKREAVC